MNDKPAVTLEDQVHAVCDLCEIKKEIPTRSPVPSVMAPHARLLILAQKAGFNLTPVQINDAVRAHQVWRAEIDAAKAAPQVPAPA